MEGEASAERPCNNHLLSLESSFFPKETHHVSVTCAFLRLLTKTEQGYRTPLLKVSSSVYKAQPAAAPAKAPPKTFLFGERGPGQHYPTKRTSPGAPTALPRTTATSSADQDHEDRRPRLGPKLAANVASLPA